MKYHQLKKVQLISYKLNNIHKRCEQVTDIVKHINRMEHLL